MLLRIIDIPAEANANDRIGIIFEHEGKEQRYTTESYTSPTMPGFRNQLSAYFGSILQMEPDSASLGLMDKYIRLGQYIGDELLGEDHQLLKIIKCINAAGYHNLSVQIESSRTEFFSELWESVIFHDSNYVLSAAVKSFSRHYVQAELPEKLPERHYKLHVTIESPPEISALLGEGGNINEEPVKKDPLRILCLTSRPTTIVLPHSGSNTVNLSLDAFSKGGFIEYELYQTMSWAVLQQRLADTSRPVHIFHYDGPIILSEEGSHIAFSNKYDDCGLIKVKNLCELLRQNNLGCLTVDSRIYLREQESIDAATGLAVLAADAFQGGIGNLIGPGFVTDPWTGGLCFDVVYQQMLNGFTLEQAVVEARKILQSKPDNSLTALEPLPCATWPLLVHYSRQSVKFFESPQSVLESADPRGLKKIRETLFGFRSEMLPPLVSQVGSKHTLELIDAILHCRLNQHPIAISIIGKPGTGKTQCAHLVSAYFSQIGKIDYGFYFDYSKETYLPEHIQHMIAPVLNISADCVKDVEVALEDLHCCFIFDGLSEDLQEGHEAIGPLKRLINTLLSQGHIVIIAGNTDSALHRLANFPIVTGSLSSVEARMLGAKHAESILSVEDKTHVNKNGEWQAFLEILGGNPWLIKKSIPLLKDNYITDLQGQLNQHIGNEGSTSVIEQFYRWRWHLLDPLWQRLLLLCSEVPGLILEAIMIVFDQKNTFKPAESLLELLGSKDADVKHGLNAWETSGYLTKLPHGRVVDAKCLSFLDKQYAFCFADIDQEKARQLFSQIICEGIRVLAHHVIKQPNPSIFNNLLGNRREWVKHFESLWFACDYRNFFNTKSTYEQLLRQAKLEHESWSWSLDLIKRSRMYTPSSDTANVLSGHLLSWLMLANSALMCAEAKDSDCILKGEEVWRSWFDAQPESLAEDMLPLFHQAFTFLQHFYQSRSDWGNGIWVANKACQVYMQYQAWPRVISTLRSLSDYYREQGSQHKALECEERIINDIPYDDAPVGFQAQNMLEIIVKRVSREDTKQAQLLLDRLKKMEVSENLNGIVEGIQSDIYFQQGNYLEALPHYCKIWEAALQSNQPSQLHLLKHRLLEIEQHIGSQQFNLYFERQTSVGVKKPKEHEGMIH